MKKPDIILVDKEDREIGTGFKEEVHQLGLLHRAFSVLIFDKDKNLLLQQRAFSKYHCGGMWTNTCCSHPLPGEDIEAAAHRRLMEEMGFDCDLTYSHHFLYKAVLENNLIEHEIDHVFIGQYDGVVNLNSEEVEQTKYLSLDEINTWIKAHPELFTPWFLLLMDQLNKKQLKIS